MKAKSKRSKLNENVVSFQGVNLFLGRKQILNSVEFSFKRGVTYILTGPSGIGKSSVLNLIAGYLKPTDGSVFLEPHCKIAYLFQDDMLFSNLTVRENILIKYLNQNVNIDDFSEILLEGLKVFGIEDLVDDKVGLLSGGEKQRVQLAEIYLSKPDLILMDEPTARLDAENKKNIIRSINSVFKDLTMIIVTHEKWDSASKSVSLSLRDGKVVEI